jgi:hypothetical protein
MLRIQAASEKCVRFLPVTQGTYIEIQNVGTGQQSSDKYGKEARRISLKDAPADNAVDHELLHGIGMLHTHQRNDRDSFLATSAGAIYESGGACHTANGVTCTAGLAARFADKCLAAPDKPKCQQDECVATLNYQYKKLDVGFKYLPLYDYSSIMHYPFNTNCIPEDTTKTAQYNAKSNSWVGRVGDQTASPMGRGITHYDALAIKAHYDCKELIILNCAHNAETKPTAGQANYLKLSIAVTIGGPMTVAQLIQVIGLEKSGWGTTAIYRKASAIGTDTQLPIKHDVNGDGREVPIWTLFAQAPAPPPAEEGTTL